ncbi:MAG: hypothetical protein JNK56_10700, partial [Myxococcales bacterium]|nr:hypothetical protein [Myxococcales bacterium]
ICTTKIADRLGKATLHRFVEKFHFGERPDIELPGATPGLLAPPEKWSDIQAANISFGQGMSASPLQVTSAFAAIANEGLYHKPTIVRAVVDADGEPVARTRPPGERVVRASTARTVLRMLENVVHSKLGTGKNATVEGYRVAGKTSTAQKSGKKGYDDSQWYSSFLGALPARAPRVVIMVSVDSPEGAHYGNDVAAPSFSRLAGPIMVHLGVPRDDGTAPPPPKPVTLASDDPKLELGFIPELDVEPDLPGHRHRPAVTVTTGLPDFTGLTLAQALDLAHDAKLELRATGTGIAVLQDRQPGPAESGSVVQVWFEPPT